MHTDVLSNRLKIIVENVFLEEQNVFIKKDLAVIISNPLPDKRGKKNNLSTNYRLQKGFISFAKG